MVWLSPFFAPVDVVLWMGWSLWGRKKTNAAREPGWVGTQAGASGVGGGAGAEGPALSETGPLRRLLFGTCP